MGTSDVCDMVCYERGDIQACFFKSRYDRSQKSKRKGTVHTDKHWFSLARSKSVVTIGREGTKRERER